MARKDIEKYDFTSDQDRTEAAKNGRKGGKVRGAQIREEAHARRLARVMAQAIMRGKDGKEIINPLLNEPQTMLAGALLKQFEKAYRKSDTAALKLLLELMGEIKQGADININTAFIQRTPEDAYAAAYGVIEGEAGEDTTEGEKCEN